MAFTIYLKNSKYNNMGHKLLFSNGRITIFLALRFKTFFSYSYNILLPPIPLYRDEIAINVIKRGHDQSVP